MSSTAQVMARIPLEDRAEYEILAALNGLSLSEYMRQCMEHSRPHFRKLGEEAAKRRDSLPHGVTQAMEDTALGELIADLNSGYPITLKLRDVFTPRSKALLRVLQLVWQVDPDDNTRKALERVSDKVLKLVEIDPPGTEVKPKREIRAQARKG